MPNVFNIIRHIDTKILDEQINQWVEEHGYAPIILMSPDTLQEIPNLEDLGIYFTRNTCNNRTGRVVGTYEGTEVFSDPSMKYGEVELR